MSDDEESVAAFLIGLIVGGLVGAVVALLFAPQSGLETRTYIKDKSIELKDKAAETVDEAAARTGEAIEGAHVRADAALADVRSRSESKKRQKVVLEDQQSGTETTPPAESAAAI